MCNDQLRGGKGFAHDMVDHEWRDADGHVYDGENELGGTVLFDVAREYWIVEPAGEGDGTCCAILTEPVSPAFAFIHDRQPVVLDPECRWQWLDPELSDRDAIRKVARRLDPDRLVAYSVSTRVNRPANDDPGLIEPEMDAGDNRSDP